MSENRFLIIHEEVKKRKADYSIVSMIVKDSKTGALYYKAIMSNSITMTPLIGPDGKHVIEAVD